jgi:transposase
MIQSYAPITQAFIDHVSEQRAQGVSDTEIATAMGISRRLLHDRIANWNRKHPDKRPDRPITQQQGSFYAFAARRTAEGASPDQIAQEAGRTRASTIEAISYARKRGLLPPKGRRTEGGARTYAHFYNKGAAPPRGNIGALLDALSREEISLLLAHVRAQEPTLAHTIARLLKERLNEPR